MELDRGEEEDEIYDNEDRIDREDVEFDHSGAFEVDDEEGIARDDEEGDDDEREVGNIALRHRHMDDFPLYLYSPSTLPLLSLYSPCIYTSNHFLLFALTLAYFSTPTPPLTTHSH